MKKVFLIIGFSIFSVALFAQKSYDYGVFLGTTMNHQSTIIPIPDKNGIDYALGGYYRFSLNPRYSWRTGINAGFDRQTFKPNMVDAFGLFEFNFHPLSNKREKQRFTSYIAFGLSYLVDIDLFNTVSQSSGTSMGTYMIRNVRIPFNVGVRYNVNPKMTVGLEWALRKGYQLDYDDPDVPVHENSISNWRSHIGITIGYLVSNYCKTCPFYENESKKRK